MSIRFCVLWACLAATWGGSVRPGAAAEGQLSSSLFERVVQSSDAMTANGATAAVDGVNTTFSLTANLPGSYWTAVLGRPYSLTRIELVNRGAPADSEMRGLTVRLFNMDDQVVYQTNLSNPGPGATNILTLPAGLSARSLWVGLPGNETNGAGNYRVGLAEARLFGVLGMPYGPEPPGPSANAAKVYQSSEYPGYPAGNAVDGILNDFTHTDNQPNSWWMADLGSTKAIERVEIVNRLDCCAARLANLVLRIFDGASNSVASAILSNPGAGATWSYSPPSGTRGRWIRVGLENGQMNGGGNYYVTLAEARVYSGSSNLLDSLGGAAVPVTNNLASFKKSYMVRLGPNVPAASNVNDDNNSTEASTTTQTVDGYWEVDLGATYAVYGVRSIAARGISYRLTNTTVRLFDGLHDSVYAKRLSGVPDAYDSDVNGPVFARYVRVGLEDKQRTDPSGGFEWYIGFREVEVFGIPTNAVGVLSFAASAQQVPAPQPVNLSWSVADVRRVEIHPGLGSVGSNTAASGLGNVSVTPERSTEYMLIASNAAGYFARAVGVEVGGAPLFPRLNQLVADNQYSLSDGYGNAADWVEIRNPGNSAVNLAGWGLSDDPAEPMKWLFPATNLAPHSTLIVFASGSPVDFDPNGHPHASFRLNKDGGALLLTAPDGTNTVDMVAAYPALDTDLAYGRDMDGNWRLKEPSPGGLSTVPTYDGWLRPLTFSAPRGFCDAAFTLTISNSNPGASVYYSLNGTTPSIPYTGPLTVSNTVTVRAQVLRPGFKSPRIQTHTYIFPSHVISTLDPAIAQSATYAARMRPALLDIPSICLDIPTTPSYQEQEGSIEVLWPNGAPAVQANCGTYYFGDSWVVYPKRSFVVKFRSVYGARTLKAPLLDGFDHGVTATKSFDKLDLRAGNQDMVERGFYLSGRFAEDTMLDMGSLNPHGRYVHLYLNGVYWGQYDCREPMMEHFMATYLGGEAEDYLTVKGNDNLGDSFVLGMPEPPHVEPWDRVHALKNSYHAVRPYLDVSHLIDFMLCWYYGNAEGEYRSAGSMEAGSGFKFWIGDCDGFLRMSALGLNTTGNTGPGGLFGALVAEGNSDFKTLLADRIYLHFFNNGALTPARNDARLGARMTEVTNSILAECARWGYRTPASWVADAATVRSSLFPARTAQLLGMLRSAGYYPSFDPPTFSQYGGMVTNGYQPQLASSSGTIYFTLDGSDPRLEGGAISAVAMVWYPGILSITRDLTVSVRVRNASGQWSALARTRFVVGPALPPTARELVITEINYNPSGPDDTEFIELCNVSSNPLDISGVTLSNAVRFTFPANTILASGAFVIMAKNTDAFAQTYQDAGSPYYCAGLTVTGPWSGSLDNGGETIQLVASNGTELASISYRTSGEWPQRADGHGSSLELRAPPPATLTEAEARAFVADGRNWTSSSRFLGSPGFFDTFVKSVRINEVLSSAAPAPDWIELHNVGSAAVDLTGCTLTDNYGLPGRYVFPTPTPIHPGEFLVLDATELGFAFGEMGEMAALLQMSGTNVLRFLDTVDFSAAAPGESFGLFQRSDEELDFTEMSAPTPGATNAPPRVGPVVISEVLADPAPGLAEFVEITSLTNAAVPLYDPLYPTNVWRLDGVGSFSFPSNAILAPLSTLIVCSTNPAAFRAQYLVSETVPVYGPWSGALDNNGETLKLLRPGQPQTNGNVPYYRVDHMTYRTATPWPPSAPGASLQRTPVQGYGNDPLNWTAATPTPGAIFLPGEKPVIVTSPQSQAVNEGEPAGFSVAASGSPPLSYQWRFNGVALPGATNTVLALNSAQISQAGAYDVLVFSPNGSSLSAAARLSVIKPPRILVQPTNQWARLGSNAMFAVVATGNGVLRYQWRLNGSSIPGANSATLPVLSVGPEQAGLYDVVVSDGLGSALSAAAALDIMADPVIVQQPLSQAVLAGESVTLSVAVTNIATLPINYRWRRGGFAFTNLYLNSRVCFFTITSAQAPYTNWSVYVTNWVKPAGNLSSNAVLTILADANGNKLPDAWEESYFGPAANVDSSADPDGDGMSNWQEYIAGTNPTNAASCLRVEPAGADGAALIRFTAVSNRTYSVLYTDSLATKAWTVLTSIVARASTGFETVRDPGFTTNRYYRIATPQRP